MRTIAALGSSLLLLLPTACSSGDEDDAGTTAVALAKGLSDGSLADVPFTEGDPTDEFGDVVAGLGDAPVEVSAADPDLDGDKGTVSLTWTWDVKGNEWSYRSSADLAKDGDTWKVVWQRNLVEPSLTGKEVIDVDVLLPSRGAILGPDETPIVVDRDVVKLGLDKSTLTRAEEAVSARAIARVLDIEVASFTKRVRASGEKAFVEALVLRKADAANLPPAYGEIKGAVAIGSQRPLAPTKEFAAPILGTVGEATAELIEKSGGRLSAGDLTGLSGLQARYDEQLSGTSGVQIEAVAGKGSERELFTTRPENGQPLTLTLDSELQLRAEQILAQTKPASAIVAIDPTTGDLLAAASGPGSKGINTATYGQYAPGSTFKVVTALALLRAGLTPDTVVPCTSTLVVDGKTFKNYDDYPASHVGDIPFRDAFAQSCNTAFIAERDRLKKGDLADAAAALGLGVDHDLGFPAYFGQVPDAASETEKAADQIGQGKILASPMAMAAVAASVRAGHTVLPRLIADHDVDRVQPEVPLTAGEAKQLQQLMRGVVTDGSAAFLADLPGEVMAKTGTAEYGTGAPLPTHTWMIASTPKLAVAVFVETGQSGSATAGPLLRSLLER
ncbi:penicillin-binding transpeptidase domain-containing protein [Nocardioides jensenii]|uniref:penicillin-binding transpeptidase domain-containing protein n=1 Tax=Nocardioides jensenii TaxID=1843 RepID=UPI0008354BF2|nr:penicillin-binding transpeptidase domain-containing protein [Nocardioides jensenii]